MTVKPETKTARAFVKQIKTSPRKLNIVAAMVRGMKAEQALVALSFSKRRVAAEVKKALNSAIANAENNHGMNADRLVVAEAWVGKSLFFARTRAHAKGKGARMHRMNSNLTVVVAEREAEVKAAKAKAAATKPAKTAKPARAKTEKKD